MEVTVELPKDLLQAEHPEREVFEAVVLRAYASRRISQGKLAEMLGINFWESEQLLGRLGIARPYRIEDFDAETASAPATS
jgi:predicted HTH domain antitoxin